MRGRVTSFGFVMCAALLVGTTGRCQREEVDPADAAIDAMDKITGEICACKDEKCLNAGIRRMAGLNEPEVKPTKAHMERAMKIAERMAACQKRIAVVSRSGLVAMKRLAARPQYLADIATLEGQPDDDAR